MNERILPVALIVIQLAAAVVYGMHHDWRRTAYWFFAAGITASVTF